MNREVQSCAVPARWRACPVRSPRPCSTSFRASGRPVRSTLPAGDSTPEIAAWAQQHLGTGTRVVSDGLTCFHGVTAAGCVHEPVVAGEPLSSARSFDRGIQFSATSRTPCAAPTIRIVPSMPSDISRSSSTVSIIASTCLTSSRDLSTWRSGRRRCRYGYSSYA